MTIVIEALTELGQEIAKLEQTRRDDGHQDEAAAYLRVCHLLVERGVNPNIFNGCGGIINPFDGE